MNQAKLENLVLLVCEAVPEHLTTTRLNKLLWILDKTAFLETGQKITGCRYIRKQYGPVPIDNGDALGVMEDKGLIEVIRSSDAETGMPRREYRAKAKADRSVFGEIEINLILKTLLEYAKWATRKLIALSHDLVWANRDDGEEINFEAYLARFNFTPAQKNKARQLIECAELAYEG